MKQNKFEWEQYFWLEEQSAKPYVIKVMFSVKK